MLRCPEGLLWLPPHSLLPNKQPTSCVRAHARTPAPKPHAPWDARRGRAAVRACQRQKDSSRVQGPGNPHARAPAPRSLGAGKPLPLGVEPESPRPHSGERHQNCARRVHGFSILEIWVWDQNCARSRFAWSCDRRGTFTCMHGHWCILIRQRGHDKRAHLSLVGNATSRQASHVSSTLIGSHDILAASVPCCSASRPRGGRRSRRPRPQPRCAGAA